MCNLKKHMPAFINVSSAGLVHLKFHILHTIMYFTVCCGNVHCQY